MIHGLVRHIQPGVDIREVVGRHVAGPRPLFEAPQDFPRPRLLSGDGISLRQLRLPECAFRRRPHCTFHFAYPSFAFPRQEERPSQGCPGTIVLRFQFQGLLGADLVGFQVSGGAQNFLRLVKSRLRRVSPIEEPDEYRALFGDLIALEDYHKALGQQAVGGL